MQVPAPPVIVTVSYTFLWLSEMLSFISSCLQVLNGKFSGNVSAAAKTRCWEQLAADVSAVSGIHRSANDIKKKWVCYKSDAKSSAAMAKKGRDQTGGGAFVAEEASALHQRVISLIGEVCIEGIPGGIDCANFKSETLSGSCEVQYLKIMLCVIYRGLSLTWSNLWKNKPVTQKLKVVVGCTLCDYRDGCSQCCTLSVYGHVTCFCLHGFVILVVLETEMYFLTLINSNINNNNMIIIISASQLYNTYKD